VKPTKERSLLESLLFVKVIEQRIRSFYQEHQTGIWETRIEIRLLYKNTI